MLNKNISKVSSGHDRKMTSTGEDKIEGIAYL